jgi:hypothetical protein
VKELVTYIGAEPVIYAIEFNKRKKEEGSRNVRWNQERIFLWDIEKGTFYKNNNFVKSLKSHYMGGSRSS